NDRPQDSRHVSAGLGNFDFNDWTLVVPVAGGRVRLRTVIVAGHVHIRSASDVELGACAVVAPEAPEPRVVDLGTGGKLEPEGSRIAFSIADRDFLRGDTTGDGPLDIADPIRRSEEHTS